jgi:hypothetical protein
MRNIILMVLLLVFPSLAFAQTPDGRFEAGGHMTYIFMRQIGTRDAGAGTDALGLGGRFTYRLSRYFDLEADMILHPNAGVSGHRVQGFFGGKVGYRFEKLGIFAKARPGFIYFSKDPFGRAEAGSTPLSPRPASSTDRSIDLGGVLEYYTARGLIVRFDLGDTIISYEPRTVVVSQLQPPINAGGFTTDNWQGGVGIGFRW